MPEILERLADQPITLAVAIQKVDREQRLVRGVATQEVLDAHGEVVDYASVKAALATWKGNIREMHQPVAVGKAVAVACDDTQKAVSVEAYISKGAEATWQKVLDGTLAMYSIGGVGDRVTQKSADGSIEKRILVSKLHEISLVDVGACPTASFDLVKTIDGQLVDAQDAAQAPDAAPEPPAVPADAAPAEVPAVAKMGASYQVPLVLQTIALLQELLNCQLWETSEDDDPAEAAAAQASVDMLRFAAQTVIDFLVMQFEGQFPPEAEAAEPMAAIAESVKATFAKIGRRNAKADLVRIQALHDNSVQLGAACGTKDKAEKALDADLLSIRVLDAVLPEIRKALPVPIAPSDLVEGDVLDIAKTVEPVVTSAVAAALAPLSSQLEEVLAKQAALQEQVGQFASSPRPGGPLKQAVPVDKTLGGVPSVSSPPSDLIAQVASVVAAELAPDLGPEQRAKLAQKVIALTQVAGGRLVVPR
jgi:hypothetical protein